ncbi:hypothetical protein [Amycolatopsis saalfeldensis]|uniref:Uncharacterized protein n=1 Tax=Amycolatopsis saalfeldensis TaxID=394193 RepID=A0A1H8YN85_9PSEU|nr:hypothetical protein [Amycolatopsis saalfeldensis]SEP53616.1 hypothetical protein SAMN04489732_12941 [Amycolatopsis saalfeldensis]
MTIVTSSATSAERAAAAAFAHVPPPAASSPEADLFDRWFVLARHGGPITFDLVGRALTDLATDAGWRLDQPARLFAPTSDHGPGTTGVKFTYARTGPDGETDYLAVAGLDNQPAEIHLNGTPLTWAELCALLARNSHPLQPTTPRL